MSDPDNDTLAAFPMRYLFSADTDPFGQGTYVSAEDFDATRTELAQARRELDKTIREFITERDVRIDAESRLAAAEAALREAREAGQTLLALSVSCYNTAAEERAWEEAAEYFAAPPPQEQPKCGHAVTTEMDDGPLTQVCVLPPHGIDTAHSYWADYAAPPPQEAEDG